MDENSRTRKKPSAISARPLQTPSGRGAAAHAVAGPPPHLAAQDLPEKKTEQIQDIKGDVASTGPNLKTYIERQLKSVYDDVLNQPIPDRFLELLNELDTDDADKAPGSGDQV